MWTIIIIFIIFALYYLIYHNYLTTEKEPFTNNSPKETKKAEKIIKTKKLIKEKELNNNIFFDIYIGDTYSGKIEIKLYDNIVPKTTNNFRTLVKEKKYDKTIFHRVIKDFMIQGGDYTNYDGTGGLSIYGDKFEDENFKLKHNKPGLLSMANSGPNTNGSQFFITTKSVHHLDNKHVVFGEVVNGMDIVELIENTNTDNQDRPINDCIISKAYTTIN